MKKKSAKKKLVNLEYSDGKNRDLDEIRNLESLLNMGSNNPYGTIDKRLFEERVEGMNLQQMADLAQRVGVSISNKTTILKERLLEAFDGFQRRHRAVLGGVERHSPDSSDIEDLLAFPDRKGR